MLLFFWFCFNNLWSRYTANLSLLQEWGFVLFLEDVLVPDLWINVVFLGGIYLHLGYLSKLLLLSMETNAICWSMSHLVLQQISKTGQMNHFSWYLLLPADNKESLREQVWYIHTCCRCLKIFEMKSTSRVFGNCAQYQYELISGWNRSYGCKTC